MSFQAGEFWHAALQMAAWRVAGAWCRRTSDMVRKIPELANLSSLDWDRGPVDSLTLTGVVPARDEAEKIAATLDALLLADYPALTILVVDDRSTDGTGAIADEYAKAGSGE